ncbi:hypothetical protein CHS0354_019094 [Potamilus streckersoni]|uniref:Uncharacterized protein n=1 Tax=Potamilus streckersoni TaxID=2493646 RepID=A0AAE0W1L1_9BIVA|nr:hypothetical protein CHS0354_019094 [Potamilus streckersoni]
MESLISIIKLNSQRKLLVGLFHVRQAGQIIIQIAGGCHSTANCMLSFLSFFQSVWGSCVPLNVKEWPDVQHP